MALRFVGSKNPRTVKQMARLRCYRCRHKPAVHQWNGCSNGNRYVALCLDCDWAVNEMFLAFLGVPHRELLMAAYRRRKL